MPTIYRLIRDGVTVNYRTLPDALEAFSVEVKSIGPVESINLQLWEHTEASNTESNVEYLKQSAADYRKKGFYAKFGIGNNQKFCYLKALISVTSDVPPY